MKNLGSTGELDKYDFSIAIKIEHMLESEEWKYIQAYIAAQWEQILVDIMKSRTDQHFRTQQGIMKGFKMCWNIPYKIVERAKNINNEDDKDLEKQRDETRRAYAA